MNANNDIPLSLYIHLPWCIKKCPYCDFNSYAAKPEEFDENSYIDVLILDLEKELPYIGDREITSIFIGGGTPSLFTGTAIDRLLSKLRKKLTLSKNCETTLEINPDTVSTHQLNDYYQTGINRLSIGVQSFNDKKLKLLGRTHSAAQARYVIMLAKKAGFKNINIDLMFGLPMQTTAEAIADLKVGIVTEATHLSWYQLTIEPNTIFYANPPALPNQDKLWKIKNKGQKLLAQSGYLQYEISAYAMAKYQCQHNINYWQFGDYLGIGAGAHSKLTDPIKMQVTRFNRYRIPSQYIKAVKNNTAIKAKKILTADDLLLEFMMNAIRLNSGIATNLLIERTGLTVKFLEQKLAASVAQGFISWQSDQLKPTEKGLRYLNNFLQLLMTAN